MGFREATRRLAIANLLLLYSLFLSMFPYQPVQAFSTVTGIAAFYLQYVGWKEMEKVNPKYSPGKLSVVETAKGIALSMILSGLAFLSLRGGLIYIAFGFSLASLIIALYYSVKAIIHYLIALKAVDRDYGTKLFYGGLLAIIGAPIYITLYTLGYGSPITSLPAAIGLSVLALEFWKLSSSSGKSASS